MSTSGGSGGAQRMTQFMAALAKKGIDTKDLVARTEKPFLFRTTNGTTAFGYEATILTDICDVVLAARKEGKLHQQQEKFADQCELLTRGFARLGIISKVANSLKNESATYNHCILLAPVAGFEPALSIALPQSTPEDQSGVSTNCTTRA